MQAAPRPSGRSWLALAFAIVISAILVFGGGLGVALGQEALSVVVRDTVVNTDGTTEIVVNVTGSAKPDVLDADAFEVTEQGEAVAYLTVEPLLEESGRSQVILVGLVIDVSGSMLGEPMAETIRGAVDLVEELTAQGIEIQLVSFASEVDVLGRPTADGAALAERIEALEARGETALYDAVAVSAQRLAEFSTPDTQLNMVVFSDGGDTVSDTGIDEAIAAASDAGVPVTLVALETAELDPEAIDAIAAGTGGRVVTAADTTQIDAAFAQVASDLASQYVLRYSSDLVDPETLELTVTVRAGEASQQLSYSVLNLREGAPPPPAAPNVITVPESSPLASTQALMVGGGAAFLAMLLLGGLLFTGQRTKADRVLGDQLAQYLEGTGSRHVARSGRIAVHLRERAMEMIEAAPRPVGLDEKLTVRLEQAAWPMRNGEFLLLIVLSAIAPAALASVLFNPLGGLLLGLLTGAIPLAVLENRRSKRQDRFLKALPDTLQLMAGSLRAGYGVMQAIDTVAKESSGPTAEEFTRVLTEARLGMPVEDALEALAERIDNEDLRWVVLAINIQREVGGNLAELLDVVAAVLREREMLRRQIKVLSAEGKLSAIILILLPVFLTVYLVLMRPEYVGILVTNGLIGYAMIIGAVVLMAGGVFWIRNLIRIEV
ncbi:type II secretion system F family protein [Nitriliruptor alkaliphilus]|uniref:type II secretion system F family protein n=1 Tax=Nitriliruptor alkaliphilus TaxID=427918 RepID=UPI0009FA1C98|nr:type II secretion system F family protein [Nitriliruptor alkaliphilus]